MRGRYNLQQEGLTRAGLLMAPKWPSSRDPAISFSFGLSILRVEGRDNSPGEISIFPVRASCPSLAKSTVGRPVAARSLLYRRIQVNPAFGSPIRTDKTNANWPTAKIRTSSITVRSGRRVENRLHLSPPTPAKEQPCGRVGLPKLRRE